MKSAFKYFLHLILLFLFLMPECYALSVKLVPDGVDPSEVTQTSLIDPAETETSFNLHIYIEDVEDFAGFELELTYDPDVVTAQSIVLGDFLGSTGRTVTQQEDIDNLAGKISFGAFNQGNEEAPAGSGFLGSVSLSLKDPNKISDIILQNIEIADINSPPFLPIDTIVNAKITPTYTVSVSSGPGGTIRPAGPLRQETGTSTTFDIIPDDCYQIREVLVDSVSQGSIASYTFPGDDSGSHTISASFELKTFTIGTEAGEGGTISSEATVNCGADKTVTITPNQNYRIADVLVDGSSVTGGTDPNFVLNQSGSATYAFKNIRASHVIKSLFAEKLPGDVNADNSVDLQDAILTLQILSGKDTSQTTVSLDADVDGDGRIGMGELIYILRRVAESSSVYV